MNRSYGYCQYTPRPRRTVCPHCGSKMGPASSDPSDKKNLCHDRVCNDTQMRKAGRSFELSAYSAAHERGNCL